ncbi:MULTISPECIES: DUF3313 domain-containing protein [Pantoea]|uniref:DUF3313 domain-containing protein n=1 Tax=Pantoea TaxID=53335 RepID=UPI001CF77C91|nr:MULTISPECIES: DUF3313 domain-containing protein [Pantoea]
MLLSERSGFMRGVLFALGMLITGCSSKVAEREQFSGFLSDYSGLEPVKTASGQEILRWVSPGFSESSYRSVYLAPVVYYPRAIPTERVSAETLEQIRSYTEQQTRLALSKRLQLSSVPEKGGLEVRMAITSVIAKNEDMHFYEVVPVAAVIGGAMALTGYRAQNSEFFLEFRVLDVSTGKDVIRVVRKGYGKTIPNSKTPIKKEDIKKAIDVMEKDLTDFPRN